jgi:hypothetical protein
MIDLRSWLRRLPKPEKLRIRTRDDEERIIPLDVTTKTKWAEVENTIRAAGAKSLEALDKAGHIIRAMSLSEEEAAAGSSDEARERYDEKVRTGDRREMAQIFDAQGLRVERAYHAGAEAAGKSADKLLELVAMMVEERQALSQHLMLAITNLHTVSTNLANFVAAASSGEGEGGGDTNNGLMQLIASMISQRGLPAAPPPAPAPPNGGAKK